MKSSPPTRPTSAGVVQAYRTPGQHTGHLMPEQDQPHPFQESRGHPRSEFGRRLDPAFLYNPPVPWSPSRTKDGGVRIRTIYKKLSAISSLGQLPAPRVGEVLDSLGKGRFFSPVRWFPRFIKITIDEDAIPLTAFCAPNRLFRVACDAAPRQQRFPRLVC